MKNQGSQIITALILIALFSTAARVAHAEYVFRGIYALDDVTVCESPEATAEWINGVRSANFDSLRRLKSVEACFDIPGASRFEVLAKNTDMARIAVYDILGQIDPNNSYYVDRVKIKKADPGEQTATKALSQYSKQQTSSQKQSDNYDRGD